MLRRVAILVVTAPLGCKSVPSTAPTPRADDVPTHPSSSAPLAVSSSAAAADPCLAPFPAARLSELASDPKALRAWGKIAVDAAKKTAKELPPTGAPGDPEVVAKAWGFALPFAYADFLRRFADGADVTGSRGRIEIWGTKMAAGLAVDSARPFHNTPTRRFVSIGTDGGDWELFIDVDDWFGKGRCAVLFADDASSLVFFLGESLPVAIDRVVLAKDDWMNMAPLAHPRPPE